MTHTQGQSVLIGTSPAMVALRDELERLAPTVLPILIEGETGVGKELVAKEIHRISRRRGDFVAVNSASIPEGMFEAELFGFLRGAFTGAVRDHDGLVVQADRGSLFLDEIATLPLPFQSKLLRVLEDRLVRQLTSTKERRVDFRIVAASNEPLRLLTKERRFREDLLHRLAGGCLLIPPLRQRLDDIPALADHLLKLDTTRGGATRSIDGRAINALMSYHWPGNIRELRQVLHRAAALSVVSCLTADCIKRSLAHSPSENHQATLPDVTAREELLRVLEQERWRIPHVSSRLGVTTKTVYARIARYGIQIPLKYHRRNAAQLAYNEPSAVD